MVHLERILQKAKTNPKRPLLIDFGGCMGAGKTYFANQFSELLQSHSFSHVHISEDEFLYPRDYRENLKQRLYSEGEYVGRNYWEIHENWLRLDEMEQVIRDLGEGKSVEYYPYERSTGKQSPTLKHIEPDSFIVFETSIFFELMDLVILVEVENEELLRRKLERDSDLRSSEQIALYHSKVQWPYWQRYRPQHADFVIDNNNLHEPRLFT